ncbi:single-stranded DNA-binding protein [Candidatus Phytoplasma melaleucae]|uniref:Single-stranded DNA-binding protein n=1 Tax=Candidatus Phytoplasma melaleucae TaxID=2982630 RepID=A0ABT9DD26_9MOLU|nr:single-stranded DNA-binding protein ['Melaleuca sp.' phytoplasma]MDO8167990.1 single-stranded DNA-binding protein ['Melaleuca sp.' phytoplasma]
MINRVVLVGRITKDPETRFTKEENIPYVVFSLAVDRNIISPEGNKKTDFIRCAVWNKPAENLTKYISKGALLGIEGKIRTRSFDNENNQKQFITEVLCDSVQFLESKEYSQYRNKKKSEHNDFDIDKKDFFKIDTENTEKNIPIDLEEDNDESPF